MKPEQYVTGKMHSIPGYLTQLDALTWIELARRQTDAGVTGAFADIGIYFGRSFYLFQLLRQANEGVFGSDLFTVGIKANNNKPSTHYDTFLDIGRRLGIEMDPDCVYKGDSAALDIDAMSEKFGPVRFMSIDAGHYLEHVETDSAIAHRMLHEAGIIAFDDFFNPRWPEVTQGVFDFLRLHEGAYKLFGYSRKKGYVARAEYAETYANHLRETKNLKHADVEEVKFFEDHVPFLVEPYSVMVQQKINDKVGRGLMPVMR